MSLLTICQQVARSIPTEIPTVIINSSNDTAKLLLAVAQDAGESLANRAPWVALVKEHTFSTVASTRDYDLPSDFHHLVNDTVWDRTNYWDMRGPLSPQQWQVYRSSILGSAATTFKRYRIRDVSGTVKFSIDPLPSSADSLVFEYVSNAWCTDSGGTAQDAWAADTDVPVLDEYLIRLQMKWRMLKRLGMAYGEEYEESERETSRAVARDGGAPAISTTGPAPLHLIGNCNIPETGFGS
jgi:hypothetical protein